MLCFFSWLVCFRPSCRLRQLLRRILRQRFTVKLRNSFWRLWNFTRLSIGVGGCGNNEFHFGWTALFKKFKKWGARQVREALVAVHCGLNVSKRWRPPFQTRLPLWTWRSTPHPPRTLPAGEATPAYFKVTSEQFRASSLLLLVRCRSHSNPAELTDERRRSQRPTW